MREINLNQLARDHSVAYNALPENYRNEDCLRFWVMEDAEPSNELWKWIFAAPKIEYVPVWGSWATMFVNGQWGEPKYANYLFKVLTHST